MALCDALLPDRVDTEDVGVRFLVEIEAGKPTVRLEHLLRVIDALGGSLQLSGLNGELARGLVIGPAVAGRGLIGNSKKIG